MPGFFVKLCFEMLRNILLQIWYLFRFNSSYAQDAEDIIFEEFWKAENGNKTGFFVEIGGYHPVRFSNTYRLYKSGWKGVIVEPTPGKRNLFKTMRPRDIFVQKAAGRTKQKTYLYCFPEGALNRILSEKEHNKRPQSIAQITEVEQLPTAEILNQTLPPGTKIDLMSLDIEGHEMSALQGNDWSRFKPSYIIIEDDNFDITNPTKSETFRYLSERGYTPIARTRRNVMYKMS